MLQLYHYDGNCAIHELTTPIIQVQKDMNTAKGMWYHVGFNTFLDPVKGVIPIWQVIKYNHIFVKEDGQWKFWDYRAHLLIRSSFEKGWVDEPVIQGSAIQGERPADAPVPDEPPASTSRIQAAGNHSDCDAAWYVDLDTTRRPAESRLDETATEAAADLEEWIEQRSIYEAMGEGTSGYQDQHSSISRA
jgi:hypothetical protein